MERLNGRTFKQCLAERRMRNAKRNMQMCYIFCLLVLGGCIAFAICNLSGNNDTSALNSVPVQQGTVQRSFEDRREADTGRGRGRGHDLQIMSVASAATVEKPKQQPVEYELEVAATAYWTHDPVDASGHGIAFDGTPAIAYKTCAVDPKVIPLQSMVYVPTIGWLRANDTGNAIKGAIIDIAMPSREAAWAWGRRKVLIKVRPPKKEGK